MSQLVARFACGLLWGEATFKCVEGKIPAGMIFVPVRAAHLPV